MKTNHGKYKLKFPMRLERSDGHCKERLVKVKSVRCTFLKDHPTVLSFSTSVACPLFFQGLSVFLGSSFSLPPWQSHLPSRPESDSPLLPSQPACDSWYLQKWPVPCRGAVRDPGPFLRSSVTGMDTAWALWGLVCRPSPTLRWVQGFTELRVQLLLRHS